ncbi:FAD:protein FMN transferase [Tamlana sp. 2_MG-2023]|uniref:FAD:protein FMN transferase n=1 Tax=unclassified Tamlana TaxID=2614803 RepID=UPI0026E4266A|nr:MULTISPECIES: FAD:protein FMN transferase [unclassified Tamlana]MDO6758639.1 FAD:protein FMN transferase [Tamlana sp. 2_MG-2023]MDO6789338.1 FAD:protein FMN transferase [Tamlana sp. 1_MG-2023]
MKNIALIIILLVTVSCKKEIKNTKLVGSVFGTTYAVTYNSEVNYKPQFDSLFAVINNSMSTYQDNSIISKLNENELVEVDDHFITVFEASKTIYEETDGAFDPTIGAVVNAWDFGPKGEIKELDTLKIDWLMRSVGLKQVTRLDKKIVKPKGTFLDFNAIAKGYGVDMIGEYLESRNVNDYLVEIGGEIRTSGINAEKEHGWKVGIESPNFEGEHSILDVVELMDEAMATSGTYRKFKIDKEGKRYAHIIDPKTGFPSRTNLLSISVIHENCMTADAYATAFKAMGLEKVKNFAKDHPELKVYLIFENDNQELETLALNGFPKN